MPKRNRGIPREYLVYKTALAKEIGARIRKRRIEMGLAQQALRERTQLHSVYITRSQYSRIEGGERLPVASEIIALADALKVTCSWLLFGHEEGKKK